MTKQMTEEPQMFHVSHHVVERPPCHCGRGPKRKGGGGNCLACHREIQAKSRRRQRDELPRLRALASLAGGAI